MDIVSVKRNIAARENGDWVDDLAKDMPAAGDLRVKTRGWYSHAARERRAELEAARTDEHRKNAYTQAQRKVEEDRIILLEECLLGWENLTEGGKTIEYSPSEAQRIVYDEAYEDLAGMFKLAAIKISSIYEKSKLDAGKNSQPGSTGDSEEPSRQTKTKKT